MITTCGVLSTLAFLVSVLLFNVAVKAAHGQLVGVNPLMVELEGCLALMLWAFFLVATFVLAALQRIATALK